jgi:hypothetical protein
MTIQPKGRIWSALQTRFRAEVLAVPTGRTSFPFLMTVAHNKGLDFASALPNFQKAKSGHFIKTAAVGCIRVFARGNRV